MLREGERNVNRPERVPVSREANTGAIPQVKEYLGLWGYQRLKEARESPPSYFQGEYGAATPQLRTCSRKTGRQSRDLLTEATQSMAQFP